MNIALIGYRGTGKSCVADLIAEKLQWSVFHQDREIVDRAGMPIPELVACHGWDYFRDLEAAVLADAAKQDRLVIDTGGGVILRKSNVECLRRNSIMFWLKASPQVIAGRIKDDTQRPSLTGRNSFIEEIKEVLAERLPLYQGAADFEIETEALSVEEVAAKILMLLREKRVTEDTGGC